MPNAPNERSRRVWLETALIFAAWAIFGLLLANQSYIQAALGGRQMPVVVAVRPALVESVLWALTTLAIFWLARRFPLERGRVLQGIAVHLVAAVVIACARTGVMVVLSWYVTSVRGRDFTLWFLGHVQPGRALLCPPAGDPTPDALLPALSRTRAVGPSLPAAGNPGRWPRRGPGP